MPQELSSTSPASTLGDVKTGSSTLCSGPKQHGVPKNCVQDNKKADTMTTRLKATRLNFRNIL